MRKKGRWVGQDDHLVIQARGGNGKKKYKSQCTQIQTPRRPVRQCTLVFSVGYLVCVISAITYRANGVQAHKGCVNGFPSIPFFILKTKSVFLIIIDLH